MRSGLLFSLPMRVGLILFLFCAVARILPAQAVAENADNWQRALAEKVARLEKENAAAFVGADHWLFLTNELRFLAQPKFWGAEAASVSRAHKAGAADPLPAILDFQRQLREHGIELLLVPVPAKAELYPEKVGVDVVVSPADAAPALKKFYDVLRERGINVLDLEPLFARNRESSRGSVYCRTDSHWSGVGCALAGEAIAHEIRAKIPSLPTGKEYPRSWKEVSITGDLATMVGNAENQAPERIALRQLAATVAPDPASPVLLLGDSHTLVFHNFLAERGGLLDQLTAELGFAPDLIGTRGSGATPVRINLYRRGQSDPQFFARKKIVVWCFAAREFTEADEGWVVQPIAK
ncbi:MAG: hypothetical protein ABI992_00820 [Chthoniobacterales bacterium]